MIANSDSLPLMGQQLSIPELPASGWESPRKETDGSDVLLRAYTEGGDLWDIFDVPGREKTRQGDEVVDPQYVFAAISQPDHVRNGEPWRTLESFGSGWTNRSDGNVRETDGCPSDDQHDISGGPFSRNTPGAWVSLDPGRRDRVVHCEKRESLRNRSS